MAITFVNPNNAVGQNAGSTTASTVSITPTLPSGSAAGDRIFVVQCASNTSATAPANWTVVGSKDTVIASALGAVAASAGQRYMSVYYRDYDGSWSMPAFTLTSATQNSHWIGAVAIRKTSSTSTWDTPTISSVADDTGTADTAHSATTGSSFTTTTNGFLIIGQVNNDNVTATTQALSQSGATFGTVTERADGGTATGNDVSGKVSTCLVTTGAAATVTATATLSAASQGGNLIVQQTETLWTGPDFGAVGSALATSIDTTAAVPIPAGVAEGNIIVVALYIEQTTSGFTKPAAFTEAGSSPVSGTSISQRILWKRQTSATGAGETTGTYDFSWTPTRWRAGVAMRFTGCATSGDPFDVTTSAVDNSAGATATPAVSVTTTVANALLLWVGSSFEDPTYTTLSGFTEQFEITKIAVQTKPQAASGSTGSLSSTVSLAAGTAAWLGALEPPATTTAAVKPLNINQAVKRAALY